MRGTTKVLIAAVVLSLAAGAGMSWGQSPLLPPRPDRMPAAAPSLNRAPVALRVGERLSFHGRWLAIPVATGWIEVVERTQIDGRDAYHIHAEGHSNKTLSKFYPVHDYLDTYLDAKTLQPLRIEKKQSEGHYRAEEVVTFDYAKGIATYKSLLNGSVKEVPIPPDTHDIISAFYWLRAQPPEAPKTYTLNIYSDEKVYETNFVAMSQETLELRKRGTQECILMEPQAAFKGVFVKRGRLFLYLGSNEPRVPLLVRVTTPWGAMTGIIDPESLEQAEKMASSAK